MTNLYTVMMRIDTNATNVEVIGTFDDREKALNAISEGDDFIEWGVEDMVDYEIFQDGQDEYLLIPQELNVKVDIELEKE